MSTPSKWTLYTSRGVTENGFSLRGPVYCSELMIREAGHNIAMIVTGMGSVEEIMKRAHLMTLAPELFELADAGLEWMANLEAVLKEPSDVEAYRRYRARALEILAMASGKQVP